MATIVPPTQSRLPQIGTAASLRRFQTAGRPGAALRGFWPGTWKAAVVLIGMLVVRLPEMYLPIVRFRPSIVVGTIVGALLMQRVGASAWRMVFQQPAVRWLALYVVAILITIPFALWPGGAFNVVYILPFVALMFVTILLCPPTRETLDRVVRWTVICGGIYASYILAFGSIVMDAVGGARLGGSGTYDPNDLAVLAVIVLQLALGLVLRERGLWRVVGAAVAVVSTLVALKTGSRGGTVALVVGTLTLLLAQKPGRFVGFAIVIAAAIPLAWAFGPESFRIRTLTFLDIGNDYTFQTDAGRWVIWQRGLGYFAQRPLIGIGAGGYAIREGEYFASQGRTGAWLTAHNTYIQVLVEVGILGAIALIGMIVAAMRGAVPLWRRPPANAPNRLYRPEIFAALVAFLAGAVFLSHAYNPMLFFSFALAAYAGRVGEAERAGSRGRGATRTVADGIARVRRAVRAPVLRGRTAGRTAG